MPSEAAKGSSSATLLEISDLRFAWRQDMPDTVAIARFAVTRGEKVFIKGASGSGKTTLLGLIGGVLVPREGSIHFLGKELTGMSSTRRDTFRADHCGYIFQMFNLIPYLSLQDNVLLPCRFSSKRASSATARSGDLNSEANRLLSALGLEEQMRQGQSAAELSVGQQQRVAACRALIGSPELIIADEPTSALDNDARGAFLDLLFREIEATGSTLLFVSHDQSLAGHFDRTIALDDINNAGLHRAADSKRAPDGINKASS